jgi:DNA-binding response OmpR family regulator
MARRRVLAIEHDWRMRKLLQANLESVGLDVQGAVSGQHGLHLISQKTPDLILLGTELPDIDASHLLERLHAQLSGQVPIIVMTTEPPSRKLMRNEGATSYLLKPFAVPALLRSVGQALENTASGTPRVVADR